MEKDFFKVPNELFEQGLSSKAIVVFCCLKRHAGRKMKCFPSRKTIAAECGIGVTTVDRAMSELVSAGLVQKVNRKNVTGGKTGNMYFIKNG